jgi:4-amino-4-deoxy-L-arabinose transferase-like glycosyltransferase
VTVATPRGRPGTMADGIALIVLLAVAGLMRLPDLATRGTWDADQGHDMLVLRSLVQDGVVPLLGPPTSIGDFHHGALYYYLLAPSAALTGGDSPLAVTFQIALFGIAAVGVTWWLARSIAGPVAGFVAGLLMAVSASAIEESTFIWNPNLIALTSAVALAGAWRAWSTHGARWWLVAAAGTAATMQCHVLGVTLLPVIGALLVADARRRAPGPDRGAVLRAGLAGLAIIALTFVPLVIHELTTDFAEVRAALDYLGAGGEPVDLPLVTRVIVVAIRVISWPLTGLITGSLGAAVVALSIVVGVVLWRWRSPDPAERTAVRWFGLGLLWSAGFLTVAAAGLAVVVPGLPNDHYHAFADPMVFILMGIGVAAAWRIRNEPGPGRPRSAVPIVVAGVVTLGFVAWNIGNRPPAVAPDGGFPAAVEAAARIHAATADRAVAIRSLPTFKPPDTYVYPLVTDEAEIVPEAAARTLVIVCDALFEAAIGAPCGGPAEAASLAADPFPPVGGAGPDSALEIRDRFEAAPGRFVTVYVSP